VEVEPFWMGKYEVTWAEYKEFMSLYGVFKQFQIKRIRPVNDVNRVDAITAPTELYDPTFTFEHGEDPRQPAVTMTQYAARQYTKWLSAVTGHFYRLPSEAEWMHAARGGAPTAYHFGDDPKELGDYAWFEGNADGTTHRVGEKKPNQYGLYDLHGNVAEWVIDELLDDGYQRFAGKKVKAADAIVWPVKPYPRVVKGGHWDDPADRLRIAARLGSHDEEWKSEDPNLPLSPWWFTSDPARGVGFRLFRPLHEPQRDMKLKFWEADAEDIQADVEARLLEGRGVLGLVDPELPAAILKLKAGK
jgi:formylglycine-generating enzyme required for sulfatase activity